MKRILGSGDTQGAHPALASQFRKPEGLIGSFVARLMEKANTGIYAELERLSAFEPGQRTLEIGFGPGYAIGAFVAKHGLRYDGIDFSPAMHGRAARKHRRLVRSGAVRLHLADFLEFAGDGGKYDRVFFANVTYFWRELDHPFAKLRAMLAPTGRLAFYMEDKEMLERDPLSMTNAFNRHSLDETLAALRRAGFRKIASERPFAERGQVFVTAE